MIAPRRRTLVLAGLLAGALLLYGADRRRYVIVYAARLPSGHVFLAENPAQPGLRLLRERERLDLVVDAAEGDPLKRLDLLALWASIQFPRGDPFPHYPPWDANAILTLYKRRITGDFCAQYAILFGQAAQSYGYLVRYVDLAEEDRVLSHFIASVYLPGLRRWVAFEPSAGFHYADARGRPLDILDIHRLLMARRPGEVRSSRDGKPVPPRQVALFDRFRFYLRNNFLTVPVRATKIRHAEGIEYKFEPYRLTWVGEGEDLGDPRFQSRRPEDIERGWDLSRASEAAVHTRAGFRRFYGAMEDGAVYRVRIPRALLSGLLDDWIRDDRYFPLDQ